MRISWGHVIVGFAALVALALAAGFVIEYLGLWQLQLPWSPYLVD